MSVCFQKNNGIEIQRFLQYLEQGCEEVGNRAKSRELERLRKELAKELLEEEQSLEK